MGHMSVSGKCVFQVIENNEWLNDGEYKIKRKVKNDYKEKWEKSLIPTSQELK